MFSINPNAPQTINQKQRQRYQEQLYNHFRASRHRSHFEYMRVIKHITPILHRNVEACRQTVVQMRLDLTRFLLEDRMSMQCFEDILEDLDRRIRTKRSNHLKQVHKNSYKRKKLAEEMDVIPPHVCQKHKFKRPSKRTRLKINRSAFFPNSKKVPSHNDLVRQVSRINEKSMMKLRTRYTQQPVDDSSSPHQEQIVPKTESEQFAADFPYLSSMLQMIYSDDPRDKTHPEMREIMNQFLAVHSERRIQSPAPPTVKESLEQCIVRRRVTRRKLNAIELSTSEDDSCTPVEFRLTKMGSSDPVTPVEFISEMKPTTSRQPLPPISESYTSSTIMRELGGMKKTPTQRGPSIDTISEQPEYTKRQVLTPINKKKDVINVQQQQYSTSETDSHSSVPPSAPAVTDNPLKKMSPIQARVNNLPLMGKPALSPIVSRDNTQLNEEHPETKKTSEKEENVVTEENTAPHVPVSSKASSREKSAGSRKASLLPKDVEQDEDITIYIKGPNGVKKAIVIPKSKLADYDDIRVDDFDPEVWEQVQQCRYLRGYDPPDMRQPDSNLVEYVFKIDDTEDIPVEESQEG